MSAIRGEPRIPLSPSSPPEIEIKIGNNRRLSNVTPQSPVSPPLMSVATKSYVSSYSNNQHTDEMAQRPSPRSPAAPYMQQQQPQRRDPSHPTPPDSSLKRTNPGETDEESEHRSKRQRLEVSQDDRMEVDAEPTNHDRSASQSLREVENGPAESSSQSQQDFGQGFLVCKSSIPLSRPDPREHLLATYGLSDLLRSVARTDPITGEKINKLRKSYEGQIKSFALSGRNKTFKSDREEDQPGPLRSLATIADEDWESGDGKLAIEITPDFKSRMEKALQLQPGGVRNSAHWEDVLGHEKVRPGITPQPSQQAVPQRIPNGNQPARPPNDRRATRGKKRSYGDDSFVGYGEGYSEGEEMDESNKRRAR